MTGIRLLIVCIAGILGPSLFVVACLPGSTLPPLLPPSKDLCSHEEYGKIAAECTARIPLECKKKDRECPIYKQCKARSAAWRACQ